MGCPQTGERGWHNQDDGGLERIDPRHGLPMGIATIWGDASDRKRGSPPGFFLKLFFALDCGCPTPLAKLGDMKIKNLGGINRSNRVWPVPDETIATFSTMRLVRKADGRHELMGGTACDQATVRKWCRRFAPFVGFASRRISRRDAHFPAQPPIGGRGATTRPTHKKPARRFGKALPPCRLPVAHSKSRLSKSRRQSNETILH